MFLKILVVFVCVKSIVAQGLIPGVKNSCFQDPEPGTCRAYLPSFYYNKAAKYCDCFVYTGCEGNENRFNTLDDCRFACNVAANQQVITNTCRNLLRGTSVLKELLAQPVYQGIQGSKPIKPDTVSSTGQVPSGVDVDCLQPPEMGPCRAYLPSYYYDTARKQCDCFVYSGCSGNENRFRSLNDCRISCDVGLEKQTITNNCTKILKGTAQWDEYLDQISKPPVQDSTIDKIDIRKPPPRPDANKDSSSPGFTSGANQGSSSPGFTSGANQGSSSPGFTSGANQGSSSPGFTSGANQGSSSPGFTSGANQGSSSPGFTSGANQGSSSSGFNSGANQGSSSSGFNSGGNLGSSNANFPSQPSRVDVSIAPNPTFQDFPKNQQAGRLPLPPPPPPVRDVFSPNSGPPPNFNRPISTFLWGSKRKESRENDRD